MMLLKELIDLHRIEDLKDEIALYGPDDDEAGLIRLKKDLLVEELALD